MIIKFNFKQFLQKYPYINDFKYPILAGSFIGGIINYEYSKYTYEKQYPDKIIPNKILIVPTLTGSVIGGIFWPLPVMFYNYYGITVVKEKYNNWVEKQIK